MSNSDTFVKISVTNRDIYDKLLLLEKTNSDGHSAICARLDKTNGKVKLNTWRSITALSLGVIIIGAIVSLAIRG